MCSMFPTFLWTLFKEKQEKLLLLSSVGTRAFSTYKQLWMFQSKKKEYSQENWKKTSLNVTRKQFIALMEKEYFHVNVI